MGRGVGDRRGGDRAARPLTVLLFTLHAHLGLTSVGLGLTVGGLVSILCTPVAGALVDQRGAKVVLVGAMVLAAAAIASYAWVRTWPELVVAVSVAEVAAAASSTARKVVLMDLASGGDRVALMAAQRSLRNLGFGVGGILAGVAAGLGGSAYVAVALLDAGSFVVAIVLLAGLDVPAGRDRGPTRGRDRGPTPGRLGSGLGVVLRDLPYLALAAADFFVSFYESAFSVALPLWIVFHTHAPRALVGGLFTLNTLIVVVAQVRATRRITGLAQARRAFAVVMAAVAVMALAWWLAGLGGAWVASVLLVVGLVAVTVAEMFASSAVWIVSIDGADEHSRGSYLSVFSLGGEIQDALGPVIVTVLISLGGAALWSVLALAVCGGSLASRALVSRALVSRALVSRALVSRVGGRSPGA